MCEALGYLMSNLKKAWPDYKPVSARRKVSVTLGCLQDGPLSDVVAEIAAAKERAKDEGITDLTLSIDTERGYYSEVSVNVVIQGMRQETLEEWVVRDKAEQRNVIEETESERATYERLRRKFEGL